MARPQALLRRPLQHPFRRRRRTPLEGKTELTNVKIEPTILGYRAVDEVAKKIAEAINKQATSNHATRLFILDSRQTASLDNYLIVKEDVDDQLTHLSMKYDEVVKSYCDVFICTVAPPGNGTTPLLPVADTHLLYIRQSLLQLRTLIGQVNSEISASERDSIASQLRLQISELDSHIKTFSQETGKDLPNDIKVELLDVITNANQLVKLVSKQHTSHGSLMAVTESYEILFPANVDPIVNKTVMSVDKVGSQIAQLAFSAINPVTTAIGFASDLLALFHTNVAVTGVDITPDREALISALAGDLSSTIETYNTAKFFPATGPNYSPNLVSKIQLLRKARFNAEGQVFLGRFQIQAALDDLNRRKDKVQKRLDQLDKYILDLEGARAKTAKLEEIKAIQAEIEKYTVLRTNVEAEMAPIFQDLATLGVAKSHIDTLVGLDNEADQFISGLLSANGSDESRAVTYVRAERLQDILSDKKPYLTLDVGLSAMGGNDKTTKNLIRYFAGAKVDFSGGAVGYWKLFDQTGKMVGGSIIRSYTGYIGQKKVND